MKEVCLILFLCQTYFSKRCNNAKLIVSQNISLESLRSCIFHAVLQSTVIPSSEMNRKVIFTTGMRLRFKSGPLSNLK